MPTIVVIGGVAAGTSAASQAKRRLPGAEVLLLERGNAVSYGACGIPYNLQEPQRPIDDLVAISAARFRTERQIDVRPRHEALRVDPGAKRVFVRDLARGTDYALAYDALVLSTGARATPLELPGKDLPGVFLLRELSDGEAIKNYLAAYAPRSALIVGGGYIGMEMAEALRARGLSLTLLEKGPSIVSGFAPEIAELAHEELARHDVRIETGISLQAIEQGRGGAALTVVTDRARFEADLLLIATGITPNVALARAAGVALGASGAIAVDDRQRTNVAQIWAAGDCAEAQHRVSGRAVWIPLGTTANKQGKIAGANAAGADERFAGVVGTSAFKLFDLQLARTGLGPSELEKLGMDFLAAKSEQQSRASSVAGGEPICSVLYVERGSGRLLGAQLAGRDGAASRINVYAAALTAGMTVSQIESLDLAYAPPFAPVYDPILVAATVAKKALRESAKQG